MQFSTISSAHFFAGCGGDITGFKMAGLRPEFAVEIGAARCATLRQNHPELVVFDQPIEKLVMRDYPTNISTPILVHVYTFPCTNYTIAGEVHAHRTGDALYLEALREAVIQWPEIIIIENVLGMKAFPRVMETWVNLAHYHTSEFVVNGDDFTLQRKARLFLILHRQPFRFKPIAEYLTTSALTTADSGYRADGKNKLADYLDANPQIGTLPPYILKRFSGAYQRRPNVYEPERTEALPLTTNYKRDRSNHLVRDERFPGGVRPFSVEELARLHGYHEGYKFAGGINERYGQVIDSVMPPVARAIGLALRQYFQAIPELAAQPKPLGHTQIASVNARSPKKQRPSKDRQKKQAA